MVSVPTVPLTLTRRIGIATNASGQADLLLFPNLATSAWSPRGSIAGGSAALMYVTEGGEQTCGTIFGFPTTGLGAMYQRYRIVGWGVRFRPSTALISPGEVIAAPLMCDGTLPPRNDDGPSTVNSAGTTYKLPYVQSGWNAVAPTAASRLSALGIPYTGSGNAVELAIDSLATLPGHGVMSHAELAAHGLHGRSKPFSPRAHEFRNIRYWNSGTDAVDNAASSATYTASFGVDLSPWRTDGWTSAAIGFTGYQASTAIGTMEIIYHVEATVVPTSGSDIGIRAATGSTYCDAAEYDQHRSAIAKVPHFSTADLVKQGEDLLYGTIEGLATDAAARVGNSLLGRLTGMVSAMGLG